EAKAKAKAKAKANRAGETSVNKFTSLRFVFASRTEPTARFSRGQNWCAVFGAIAIRDMPRLDLPLPIRLPAQTQQGFRDERPRESIMSFVLAIDQGTTSSRAIVFRSDISIAAVAQQEFPQHFPASGWVEHEPDDIWTSTVMVCREALKKAGLKAKDIAATGITNQRETTLVWDRKTGQAVTRPIVWQDRRTADICAQLKAEGHEAAIAQRTGLIIDPYFSGTKVAWILDQVPGARA